MSIIALAGLIILWWFFGLIGSVVGCWWLVKQHHSTSMRDMWMNEADRKFCLVVSFTGPLNLIATSLMVVTLYLRKS